MTTKAARREPVDVNNEHTFTPDPLHRLLGIFENSEAGTAAAEELKTRGFDAGDIEMFCGFQGEEAFDFQGEAHGLFARLLRAFRNITHDRVIMDRYQEALPAGHCLLMVHIRETAQKIDASETMERHGATQVDHFGLIATEAFPHKHSERPDPNATF